MPGNRNNWLRDAYLRPTGALTTVDGREYKWEPFNTAQDAHDTLEQGKTLFPRKFCHPDVVGRYSSRADNPEPSRIMLLRSSRRYGKSLLAAAYALAWYRWQTYHFMQRNFPTLAGYNTNVQEY
jgi:hypothetical protein